MKRETTQRTPAWLAVAIASILALTAGSAPAQTTNRNDKHKVTGTIKNPCTGEPVAFEGFEHIKAKITTSNNGDIHFVMQKHLNAQGINEVTRVQYSVGNAEQINARFAGPGPVTFRKRMRVVSQGPKENFFVTAVEHFNGNGEQTAFKFEADCRGGKEAL